MTDKKQSVLDLDSVLEVATLSWYEEHDSIRLMQAMPTREIILTEAGRSIWLLIADGNWTAQEIVAHLRFRYREDLIIATLEAMLGMGVIVPQRDFLWQEE